MNRLTGITQPGNVSTSFGYDTRGRRTSVTDPNDKTTSYQYDDADRLTLVVDAAGNSVFRSPMDSTGVQKSDRLERAGEFSVGLQQPACGAYPDGSEYAPSVALETLIPAPALGL